MGSASLSHAARWRTLLGSDGRTPGAAWQAQERVARVRAHAEPILQTAIAAGVAWLAGVLILGSGRAFFAPVAAMIVLGVAPGRRVVRSLQVVLGIGLGILVGEIVVALAGPGVPQVMVTALIALCLALLLDPSPLFASQVAVSAVIVVTLEPLMPGSAPTRLAGALIGGVVGLVVLGVFTRDPSRVASAGVARALEEAAATIGEIAAAVEQRDAGRARDARTRAVGNLPALAGLPDVVDRAREAARLRAPTGRLAGLERHVAALAGLQQLGGDIVVLARSALRAIELGDEPPEPVVEAIRGLADGADGVVRYLRDGTPPGETRIRLADAAVRASAATAAGTSMAVGSLTGELRSVAADLLQATGIDRDTAVAAVRGSALGANPDAAAVTEGGREPRVARTKARGTRRRADAR